MKKIIAIMVMAIMLAGCGARGSIEAALTGHTEYCIDGVEYIQFTSGVSVAYTPEGKVKECSK